MSNVVFGRDMILEINVDGYKPVGCAVSCSFEFENELIGKTDVNAGLFRKKRVRMSDCRASVQGLTTLENDTTLSVMYILQESVRRSDQDLRFRFTDEAGVSRQIQGIFLISGVSINGTVPEFSEFDISFEGSGGISSSVIDDESGEDGIPGEIAWDWWEGVESETEITGVGHYGRSFAGKDVIEVDREGVQFNLIEDNPPSIGFAHYDGTSIIFSDDLPFSDGTKVFVIWQEEES